MMSVSSEIGHDSDLPTRDPGKDAFVEQVAARFGVMPNFFCSAPATPGLIEELWSFAKSAYLDSPLPSVFKERLFVYLSRFCRVRYCIVRHVGFLIGKGCPAGDPDAVPETVEQVVALLRRPVPDSAALGAALVRLEAHRKPAEIPAPRTRFEADLFDTLTVMFLEPQHAERARQAVKNAVGDRVFEMLAAYLAFIRTAHYWTELHPDLAYEPDMAVVIANHGDLAQFLLDPSEAERVRAGEASRDAIRTAVRENEQRTRELFRQAPGIMAFLRGPDHVFEFANDSYLRLVGDRDLLGKPVREVLSELAGQGFFDLLDRVYRTGEPVTGFETPVRLRRKPDGPMERVFVDFVYQPIANTAGAVTGIFVEGFDVTDRVAAQAALRESEERYRKLFNSIDEGFCIIEALPVAGEPDDYRYVAANPALEVHTGAKNVLGKTIKDVLPREAQPWIDTFNALLRSGEPIRFERNLAASGRTLDLYAFRLEDGTGRRAGVIFRDITERKEAEGRQRLLLAELNHRVKNTLAVVQSIASQTLRGADIDGRVRDAFEGRLMALAQAHDLLTKGCWEGAVLRDLALRELSPYGTEDGARLVIEGPEVRLRPTLALALGMAFHELATNAAKYGALSNAAGQVRLAWEVVHTSGPAVLRLHWTETGGPLVEKPPRQGFGSRLIERGVAHELNGDVQLRYEPSGIVYTLNVPLTAEREE
jgi:PAS domain S-box-containing protein